jgi:hypothetical protein
LLTEVGMLGEGIGEMLLVWTVSKKDVPSLCCHLDDIADQSNNTSLVIWDFNF